MSIICLEQVSRGIVRVLKLLNERHLFLFSSNGFWFRHGMQHRHASGRGRAYAADSDTGLRNAPAPFTTAQAAGVDGQRYNMVDDSL